VLSSLADRREEAGDRDAGERIRWRLVAQGYAEALIALANRDEMTAFSLGQVWERGLEPDGSPSGPWTWAEEGHSEP
jgi:hypothetical protein